MLEAARSSPRDPETLLASPQARLPLSEAQSYENYSVKGARGSETSTRRVPFQALCLSRDAEPPLVLRRTVCY